MRTVRVLAVCALSALTLPAWGFNSDGQVAADQLRSRPAGRRPLPERPLSTRLAGFEIHSISAGYDHSLVIAQDGTVWAWGKNRWGQLGDGTTLDSVMPVQVKGLQNAVSVAAGAVGSVAVLSDGSVWRWGAHEWNEGTLKCLLTPERMEELTGTVAVVANIDDEYLALRRDGTVWQWAICDGCIGPVQVTGLDNAVAISIGGGGFSYYHGAVVRTDGTVWSWGGEDTIGSPPPTDIGDAVAVGVGMYDYVTLKSDGALRQWGYVTVRDLSGLSGVAAIAVGSDHVLAVKSSGEVWGAGCGGCVWEKDGTYLYSEMYGPTPARIEGLTDVVAVATSFSHGLALKRDGTVWAWGNMWGAGVGLLVPVQIGGIPPCLVQSFRPVNPR